MIIFPPVVVAGVKPTLTYITNSVGSGTHSGLSFGAEHATRRLIVPIVHSGDPITAVTIGGVSASLVVRQKGTDGSISPYSEIWIAHVPTGTSGTVSITGAGSQVIGLYHCVGLRSSTATDTATDPSGDQSFSIDIESRGVVVCLAGSRESSATPSGSFTNATTDYTNGIGPFSGAYFVGRGGSYTATAAETRAISNTGMPNNACGVAAAFR